MKVWYDACTGKHVRYGVAIAKRLRALGREVILTTRSHPDTLALASLLEENFIKVGKYDPTSQMSRLRQSLKRQLLLCRMFEENVPDVAISHRSVELCRIAFGLGIPNVSTHDAPHAEAINRLTMSLIDFLVVSKALPKRCVEGYGIKKIFRFDGVDEVAWIKDFEPKKLYDFGKPLIVVRQFEAKAAYVKKKVDLLVLAKRLTRVGKVVFLPRYSRRSIKGLIVPEKFVDSASLVAQADLFIGAGGTITREAALQGTPAIIIKPFQNQYVNEYLVRKGFPIFEAKPSEALNLAKKLLDKKCDVKDLLAKLENPVDVITNIVKKIGEANETISTC